MTSAVADLAMRRETTVTALDRHVTARMLRAWAYLRLSDPQRSFVEMVLPAAYAALKTGQETAAEIGAKYVDDVAEQWGLPPGPAVNASRFAGAASDGRDLASLLASPLAGLYRALAVGVQPAAAFQASAGQLERIAVTQIHDASRVAGEVTTAANHSFTGYVRSVEPGACGRCVILAGRFYRWSYGFLRHPRCRCQNRPVTGDNEKTQSPKALFDAMTQDEQDRAFTVDGAHAIRLGADPARVVNARQGMSTTDLMGHTVKSTTVLANKQQIRLMPESIFRLADDRDDAIRLLRFHQYIN